MSYSNIINSSGTQTKSAPSTKATCEGGTNPVRTLTLSPPQPIYFQKEDDSNVSSRSADTSGSFSAVKRGGHIKMTPMAALTVKTQNFLGQINRNSYKYEHFRTTDCCPSGLNVIEQTIADLNASWTEQGDFLYWSKVAFQGLPWYRFIVEKRLSGIEASQARAWAELYNGYNLGEELGELRETIHFLTNVLKAARHPLESFKTTRDKLLRKGGTTKAAADLWMSYRYGLSPLIYSTRDIVKLYSERKNVFKTVRKTIDGAITDPIIPDAPKSNYFFDRVIYGTCASKITVKGKWTSSSLRTVGQIDVNPLTTAWALTPYSFVVDWFINVSDYLQAITGSIFGLSAESNGCMSYREKYQVDTYFHYYFDERYSTNITGQRYCNGKLVKYLTPYTVNRGSEITGEIKLRTTEVDRYSRVILSPHQVKLTFNPYLDWKRIIDGSILTLRSATTALRRLK